MWVAEWQPMRVAFLLFAATGCTGLIGSTETPDEPAPVVAPKPNAMRIVRLGHRAYARTIEDLTGEKVAVALPADGAGNGFDNTAAVMAVTESFAIEYRDVARTVADKSVDRLVKGDGRAFVTEFGKRAFRRPLRTEEVEGYVALYASAEPRTGARIVIETMLQSPSFLYRTELNERLDPYETASALSYALWETMPDDALFAAADRGDLNVSEQARRMLRDPRARGPVVEMFRQMLGLNALKTATWAASLTTSMETEVRTLVEQVAFEKRGSLSDLLVAPVGDRFGLLTTAAFLTAQATPLASSPPRRGKVISERFLCREVAPPPPDVMATVPTSGAGTTRDRFNEHTKNASCRGCHAQLDPLGFAFENYDQLGRYRTIDNGLPVDAKTTLSFGDVTGEVNGAVELEKKLAASDDVRRCFNRQVLRWTLGRMENEFDSLDAKGSIEDVLVAIVTSPSFLVRSK